MIERSYLKKKKERKKSLKVEEEKMEHWEFWRLIQASQMLKHGWLQNGGFGIDLSLSTQSSLSVLLFEALCP